MRIGRIFVERELGICHVRMAPALVIFGASIDPGDDSINGCEVNFLSIGQLSQYASLYLSDT